MADERLYKLYKLHKIDAALLQLKSRADHLDAGQGEAAIYKKLDAESKGIREEAGNLRKSAAEIEVREQQAESKLEKFQKQLYDGSLVNPREIENVQKEIEMLETLVVNLDDERKGVLARLEAVASEAGAAEAQMAKAKAAYAEKRDAAKVEHEALVARFREVGLTRAAAEKAVEPALLAVYASSRKKTGGTGVALVTADHRCAECGIDVPEKIREAVQSGKAMGCESCRRILFILTPRDEE